MRPDGMGRPGSLMASTWRSNQSFTIWLVPHTRGPVSSTPAARSSPLPPIGTPDASTPQPNAHMGGNQVIGLASASTSPADGRAGVAGERTSRNMHVGYAIHMHASNELNSLSGGVFALIDPAETEAIELGIKALPAEAEDL